MLLIPDANPGGVNSDLRNVPMTIEIPRGAVYSMTPVDRAAGHLANMLESSRRWDPRPGEVYTLRARTSGVYSDVRSGGIIRLRAGDVWKIGESIHDSDRYPNAFYRANNVYYQTEFRGGQLQIKMVEKSMLVAYMLEFGTLPPGNRILR